MSIRAAAAPLPQRVAAAGGRGGCSNTHYPSNRHRAPEMLPLKPVGGVIVARKLIHFALEKPTLSITAVVAAVERDILVSIVMAPSWPLVVVLPARFIWSTRMLPAL